MSSSTKTNLMLSNTCKYAIRAVTYIAVHEEKNRKIGIKEIAQGLDLPSPFLSKILQILSKNKILKSTKGPNGGFVLYKKPEELNLLSVVEVIDGTDFFETCMLGLKICENNPKNKEHCPFHNDLDVLRDQLYNKFKKLTFADFKTRLSELDVVLEF